MRTPRAPTPDDKDWTWVLTRPCPDCGFDAAAVQRDAVKERTVEYTAAILERLRDDGADQRSSPQIWSPLEYACHVRDVCELFERRLRLMLDQDDPLFANWDQDATALQSRYWEQSPVDVEAQLVRNADVVGETFARVRDAQWDRPGRRSNGSSFSVDSLARYFLHDLAHHAWDVRLSG